MILQQPMRILQIPLLVAALCVNAARAQTPPDSARVARAAADSSARKRAPFWPDSVRGPKARAGRFTRQADHRVLRQSAFEKMGILGELPPKQMMAKLEEVARSWEKRTRHPVQAGARVHHDGRASEPGARRHVPQRMATRS